MHARDDEEAFEEIVIKQMSSKKKVPELCRVSPFRLAYPHIPVFIDPSALLLMFLAASLSSPWLNTDA